MQHPPADSKYSKKQVENAAKSNDLGRAFFEKQFPDYDIKEIKAEYYEQTGWHIYMKMWRKKPKKQKAKQNRGRKKKRNRKAVGGNGK